MIITVTEKNNLILKELKEIEDIVTSLNSIGKLNNEDTSVIKNKIVMAKNNILKEDNNEESVTVNINYDTEIYSYRLILNSDITLNEIKKAIRNMAQKIKNCGIPIYKEYVDYLLEETCKKNEWKIEKLSQSPIIENL